MIGIICTPDEPVPITPTRRPVKSTPSCGHRPVWYHLPLKLVDALEVGHARRREIARRHHDSSARVIVSPSVVSSASIRSSCRRTAADLMRVLSCTSRRRSKRSATWLMYFRISGCVP